MTSGGLPQYGESDPAGQRRGVPGVPYGLPYGESAAPPVCPRHPNVISYVRCQRCGRPTCPQCQRPASVGIQCVDCVRDAQRRTRTPTTVAGAKIGDGRPVVTYTIIAITALVYLGQLIAPELSVHAYFIPAWGLAEPWRFLTAALLHVGMWHILLNMYALYLVGPTLEGVLGRARFLTLYILGAIGGSVAVLLFANPADQSWFTPVAGASGAIFGLFGALALTMRRMKRSDTQILIIIAINIVLGFVISGISWQGHIGGLITGSLLAAIYLYAPRRHSRWIAVAASIAVAVLLAVASLVKYGVF